MTKFDFMTTKRVTLLVDLDKTLISQDSTVLCLRQMLRRNFWVTLTKGLILPRKEFKRYLIENVDLTKICWKYNQSVKDYIEVSLKKGSRVFLVTGSSERVARYILDDYPVFSGFYCSNEMILLKFEEKARLVNEVFGVKNFDYIGDSFRDRHVWQHANLCLAPSSRFLLKCILRLSKPPIDLKLV